jgi:hypothetical protein
VTTLESAHSRAWWPIALYPLAVPISFIVVVWMATQIHPIWLVRPIFAVAVALLLVTIALSLLLNDRDRGGLAAFAIGVALVVTDLRIVGLLLLVAGLIVVEGLINRGRPWRFGSRISRILSALGIGLVVVVFVSTAQQGALGVAVADITGDLARPAVATSFDPDAPDIWVILLDGYPGDRAALLDPSFDADEFPAALEKRGFDVQRDSHPNYLGTHLALPSMFAGTYLGDIPELEPPFGSRPEDERRLRVATEHGDMLRVLRDAGYETTTVYSGWSHLGLRRVDRVIDLPELNEFELILAGNTAVGVFLDALDPAFVGDQFRGRIEGAYRAAEGIAEEAHDRPQFTFVHIPSPHLPLVYDAHGDPVADGPSSRVAQRTGLDLTREVQIERTFGQATHIGQRTVEAIDAIIAASPRPPVIVIWSDHGTDVGFNVAEPLASDLTERTSNFLAVLSPGRPDLFRAGTTPVNVLAQVFNAYLGTHLVLQDDETWAWRQGSSSLDSVPLAIP